MPNHVTNVITAPKHVIDSFVNADGDVDFSLIIPEPDNLERGGCNMQAVNGVHLDTGEVCWYEWNTRNYGVKWNAYNTERVSDTEIRFDTAWATPEPVIAALHDNHEDTVMHVKYADEDLGYNFGSYTIMGGGSVHVAQKPKEGTNEAILWAYRLKYGSDATMDDLRDEGYIGDEDED